MIHRRLLWDDSRGVGEPLNETDGISSYPNAKRIGTGLHVTGSHYIHYNTPAQSLSYVRSLQSRIFSPLVLGFTSLTTTIQQWITGHKVTGSWIGQDLPINVDLMTLQAIGGGQHILRLSHQFGVGEDPKYSTPVTVDLSTLFSGIELIEVKEVSLTTNQEIANMKRLQWKTNDEESNKDIFDSVPFAGTTVTINPMDIRTFTFKIPAQK